MDNLRAKPGEPITADKWNSLAEVVSRGTSGGGTLHSGSFGTATRRGPSHANETASATVYNALVCVRCYKDGGDLLDPDNPPTYTIYYADVDLADPQALATARTPRDRLPGVKLQLQVEPDNDIGEYSYGSACYVRDDSVGEHDPYTWVLMRVFGEQPLTDGCNCPQGT